jgi:hypothetical protein
VRQKKRKNCSCDDIVKVSSPVPCAIALNELCALLPDIRSDNLDQAVFLASKLYGELCDSNGMAVLLSVLNEDRRKSGFSEICGVSVLEDALPQYLADVNGAFSARIAALPKAEYAILLDRIAAFGVSPIMEHIIEEYALAVSAELEKQNAEIAKNGDILNRSSVKENHHDCVDHIRQAATQWNVRIRPLQIYAHTIGSNEITGKYEGQIVGTLSGIALELIRQNTPCEAMEILFVLKSILPATDQYASRLEAVDQLLLDLSQPAGEIQKNRAREYKRLSEEAWTEEQRKNDEFARQRAKEAAQREKEHITQAQKELDDDLAILRARYKQIKAKEEADRLAERKAQEKQSLILKRENLRAQRNRLGFFAKKEKRTIDEEIAEIERKLREL